MKLPWVSRELYDRVVTELESSERERRALLERLLATPAPVPVDPDALVDALTKKATEEPESFAPAAVSINSPSGFARHVQEMFDKERGTVRS